MVVERCLAPGEEIHHDLFLLFSINNAHDHRVLVRSMMKISARTTT